MKNILGFGILLWVRRIVLFMLVVGGILALVLFFVANSPLVIKKVAQAYAGDYNISYDSIDGNALTGVKVHNPRYNNHTLAKEIQLKWNPNTLATKVITVNKLHVTQGNVDTIKGLIASFSEDENSSTPSKDKSAFDFTVNVEDIALSLSPFIQNNIAVKKATFTSESLLYNTDTFSVDDLNFVLESNVTNIDIQGSLKEQIATLSSVTITEVNVSALMGLFPTKENTNNETKDTHTDTKQPTATNIFIPKMLNIDTLHTDILPFNYDPLKINHVSLDVNDVKFDIEKLVLNDADLDLNVSTNLSHMTYQGTIEKNHLLGTVNVIPTQRLYTLYDLPLRYKAIKNITVDLNASEKYVMADIQTKGKRILKAKKDAFNVDINDFTSHLEYTIENAKLVAKSIGKISTPYTKNIIVTNSLLMDKNLSYSGEITSQKLMGFDAKYLKPLEDLSVVYHGDKKSLASKFSSKAFEGTFDSKDFKTANLHLETISAMALDTFVTLPKELIDTQMNLVIDMPIDFNNTKKMNAKVNLTSNVVNVDANIEYANETQLKGKISIPKDSLLKAYSKEVKYEALSPLDTTVDLAKEKLSINIISKALNATMDYSTKQGEVKGNIKLGGLTTNIFGNVNEKLNIQTNITSMTALSKELSTIYTLEPLPPIEGNIDARIVIDKLKEAKLILSAPKLIYKADKKTTHTINDVSLVASMDKDNLRIDSYNVIFNKQKYYSNKQANISLGEMIEVSDFWINDELKVTGNFNTKNKKGLFIADAENFHIKDKVADIHAQIHLTITLDENSTAIEGKIVLLNGKLTPDLEAGKSFASDSDIIIIQEMKKVKKSPFMDTLSLTLKIETKEALILKKAPINIRLKPDFTINKDKSSELLYFGSVALLKGGSYVFEDKRFILGKSFVYFTGDINKPVLDMKAKYKSLNHLISIAITGTPIAPNINFSSSPSLTREQILSVILFDTEAGGDTQNGNEMMKMMGGVMAKAALSDVGISVDHLVFGEGNSVEVGKKLTNKITVIYVNDVIPKVKLKYQHGKHTESVIGGSEESQSYDIIYKTDF